MSAEPRVANTPEPATVAEQRVHWPADDLGPASVHCLRLSTGHDAIVVVDDIALGPAIGGVRMSPTVDAAEVARLARAMTLKNAAAALPHGGAKAGIVADPPAFGTAERERVIRGFAEAIRTLTDYIPGPDMGTDETAMAWIHDAIGRAVGLPAVLGGIPLDEIGATGYGLAVCADALQDAGVIDLGSATVAIQGFGAVGRHVAVQLHQRGAKIVAVSDSRGAVHNPAGLDMDALVAFKSERNQVQPFPGGRSMARDEVLGLACDLLIPAAQPDAFDAGNADAVRAKVILQGANIPATAEAEAAFHRAGIFSVPDIVANAGGVICAAVEFRGGGRTEAFAAITEKVRTNTMELLDRLRHGAAPREAAEEMARSRVTAARAYRWRW